MENEQVLNAFADLVTHAIYEIRYGQEIRPKREHVRQQISRINDAIKGARTLGIIPSSVPKLSGPEVSLFATRFNNLCAIEASPQLMLEVILGLLRERGVPEETLDYIRTRNSTPTQQSIEQAEN